jgi:hypothetical protein
MHICTARYLRFVPQIGSLLKDAAPKSSPAGQTLIDRLAVGTAYAVTAPRSVAAGSGLADLRK